MRIVVIDDHPIVRRGLEDTVSREPGLEVVGTAASTDEGEALIVNCTPDLAIVDLKMPGGGGLELIRRCRKKVPACRYIILTSYLSSPEVAEAFANRVEGYVLKDALPEELLTAIRLVAGGRRYYDPQVMEHFLDGSDRKPLERLTDREIEILQCLAEGLSNKEIARKLFISDNTVKKHISHILGKLELEDRTKAALFAVAHGLGKG